MLICNVCGNTIEKGSREWIKLNDYKLSVPMNDLIMCNDCALCILKARRDMLTQELDRLNGKIHKIEPNY